MNINRRHYLWVTDYSSGDNRTAVRAERCECVLTEHYTSMARAVSLYPTKPTRNLSNKTSRRQQIKNRKLWKRANPKRG